MLPKGALKRARARTEDSFGSAVRAKGVLHIEKIAIMALQLGNKLAQSQHWKRRGEERKKGKSVAFVCARIRLSLSTKAASSDQIHLNMTLGVIWQTRLEHANLPDGIQSIYSKASFVQYCTYFVSQVIFPQAACKGRFVFNILEITHL